MVGGLCCGMCLPSTTLCLGQQRRRTGSVLAAAAPGTLLWHLFWICWHVHTPPPPPRQQGACLAEVEVLRVVVAVRLCLPSVVLDCYVAPEPVGVLHVQVGWVGWWVGGFWVGGWRC